MPDTKILRNLHQVCIVVRNGERCGAALGLNVEMRGPRLEDGGFTQVDTADAEAGVGLELRSGPPAE